MVRLLLLSAAIPLSCVAFSSKAHHPIHQARHGIATSTSLEAESSSRRELLQHVATAAAAASIFLGHPTVTHAAGAYTAEAGYDDFSNGLSLPKYNVDNEAQLGLSAPGNKTGDPKKVAAAEAKAEAARAKAAAKKEAAASKKAASQAAEEAKIAADAAKIAAKEEAKKRQLEKMSDAQRAKIEAYEAKKAENAGKPKGPGVGENMKRMYGL